MIAQSLGQRGIEIIGCDSVGLTVLSFSKYVRENHLYTPFHEDEEQFIKDLVKIISDKRPDDGRPYVLMPSFNDAKIIARHKDKFPDYIIVTTPDYEAIKRVSPKDNFAQTAKDLQIAAPETHIIKSEDDINAISSDLNYPVFIKPPDEAGGRGISKLDTKDQLGDAYRNLMKDYPGENILVQGKADGKEYCFCGLFDRGQMLCSMVYQNLKKFPQKSGPGVMRETVKSERFEKVAAKLMNEIDWHGVVEIDFMWDEKEDTVPLIIEVNPRFWTGLDHSVNSNLDFPWLLYQLYVEGAPDETGEATLGFKSNLQGLTSLARMEGLFDEAVDFEKIQEEWPKIKEHFGSMDFKKAFDVLKDALTENITFDQAYKAYKAMQKQEQETQTLTYADDDPFVGLGFLYILGSLIRHGKLPPEITR